MIRIGSDRVELSKVLNNLISCTAFDFHLTGSRLFGGATRLSDWNFFAQNDSTIRAWLTASGFRSYPTGKTYGDKGLQALYSHPTGVDVLLVDDVKIRQIAQEILLLLSKENPHFTKPSVTQWNEAITWAECKFPKRGLGYRVT